MDNFIGLNIKYLCDKNFLSQADFGNLFGITQAVVNAYIKSKSNPQISTIQKICKHFELNIDDFINVDLSKGIVNKNAFSNVAVNEPQSSYGNNDEIIVAQRETIETLKKHNATLERLVETLEEKLSQAS